MEILKRINKTVKAKQIGKIIGGITCCGIGLYLLCDYFEQSGWTKCQQFIHQYYPEEYLALQGSFVSDYRCFLSVPERNT